MKILRKATVAAKLGVTTRTIDRYFGDPAYSHLGFPQPLPIGDTAIGFIESEIDDWIAARAALRGRTAAA